jgi:hypothetical protein
VVMPPKRLPNTSEQVIRRLKRDNPKGGKIPPIGSGDDSLFVMIDLTVVKSVPILLEQAYQIRV